MSRSLSSRLQPYCSVAILLPGGMALASCEGGRATGAVEPTDSGFAPRSMVINSPSVGGTTMVGVGDTLRLNATAVTRRGRNFHWASSNALVARVNSQGIVVAQGAGSADVYAISTAHTDRWTVEVGKAVSTIEVTPDSVVVTPGSSKEVAVVLRAGDGSTVSGQLVTYRSINTTIATVTTTGLVMTTAAGATREGESAMTARFQEIAPPAPFPFKQSPSKTVAFKQSRAKRPRVQRIHVPSRPHRISVSARK